MTVFESKYRELSFYVGGRLLSFRGGSFSTNDKDVIAVLEGMRDVNKVSDPKPEPKPKAEKPKRKKSSAK